MWFSPSDMWPEKVANDMMGLAKCCEAPMNHVIQYVNDSVDGCEDDEEHNNVLTAGIEACEDLIEAAQEMKKRLEAAKAPLPRKA